MGPCKGFGLALGEAGAGEGSEQRRDVIGLGSNRVPLTAVWGRD